MRKLPKEIQASVQKISDVVTGKQKECTLNKKDIYNICVVLFQEGEEMYEKQVKEQRERVVRIKKDVFQAFAK